jgi:small subunit ribosomal protein S20
MAKNLSVMKRIAVAERNRCRNKVYKSTIKTLTRKYLLSINGSTTTEDYQKLQSSLSIIYSKIDKAVKRGVFHQNNGARKKAFLAKALKKVVFR